MHPRCAVCDSSRSLEVHHLQPFHLRPDLELEPLNLLTLCDGLWGLNCHFVFGHLRRWRAHNVFAETDAVKWYAKLNRAKMSVRGKR